MMLLLVCALISVLTFVSQSCVCVCVRSCVCLSVCYLSCGHQDSGVFQCLKSNDFIIILLHLWPNSINILSSSTQKTQLNVSFISHWQAAAGPYVPTGLKTHDIPAVWLVKSR